MVTDHDPGGLSDEHVSIVTRVSGGRDPLQGDIPFAGQVADRFPFGGPVRQDVEEGAV